MIRAIFILMLWSVTLGSYAWNAMGHQLVAQIAYDNLTPKAKKMVNQYNRSLNKFSPSSSFVFAATWLDYIRAKDIHWFDALHYIDVPFSKDGTSLPPAQEVNALWGIKQAVSVLSSKNTTNEDKGLSLRILTHVVGDIHQPLHTASQISYKLPKGDLGGNLFRLGSNPIGPNLHKYWDNGAGVLLGQSEKFQVKNKAHQLEKKWSCSVANKLKKPEQWVRESHQIALSQAYILDPGATPTKRYQLNAQNTSQKQILIAGCRLAQLLNSLA